ncbi:MAG: aldo/keto reductase [Oscillospiraceae bacterium]|nr:aldo/keto reductase [Oscillospiraceae bacterium]MDD4368843.1 aldo/keto reductase [Oscillospiraceae bacterium]
MKEIELLPGKKTVSALCLGCGSFGAEVSEADAFRQLDRFLAAGGSFVDTARIYGAWMGRGEGLSETTLGHYFKQTGRRHDLTISTKGGHPQWGTTMPRLQAEDLVQDVKLSLRALQTDYIDLYYVHRDNPDLPVEAILAPLEALCQEGLIGHYACSNWALPRLQAAQAAAEKLGYAGFSSNQLMWSLADIDPAAVDWDLCAMNAATYAYQQAQQLPAMAYSSLAHGYWAKRQQHLPIKANFQRLYHTEVNEQLAELMTHELPDGYSVLDISLLYFSQRPFPVVPIAAFRSEAQLNEALAAMDKPYPEDFMQKLSKIKPY